MSTTRTGRDGRPLVTTAQAAYSLGMKPGQFRAWASRHSVRPADHQANPKQGQALALWDLADLADALNPKQPAA
ncbi:hypothetical protein [Streptomyces sp. KR55]|uniref:hypothetical protein n=1 Tax=Streptomyces sp. KR55 TaxID=3457425 RepID=UPI003FD36C40